MKTVFSSPSAVIHLFAQRTQHDARTGNGSVFFEDDRIYSWGTRYQLGEFFTGKDGEAAIMINNTGYSNSTRDHINILTQGTRQYRQFFEESADLRKLTNNLVELLHKFKVARKPEVYILQAKGLWDAYHEYAEFRWGGPDVEDETYIMAKGYYDSFDHDDLDHYLKVAEEIEKKRVKRVKKKYDEAVKKFMRYEIDAIYYAEGEDLLRLSKDKEFVETTQRIRVPVEEAKRLYQHILAGHDIIGREIMGYTVLSVNGTLKIGCHHINMKSVHKVGAKILS